MNAGEGSLVAEVPMINAGDARYDRIVIVARDDARWNRIAGLMRGLYAYVAVWS